MRTSWPTDTTLLVDTAGQGWGGLWSLLLTTERAVVALSQVVSVAEAMDLDWLGYQLRQACDDITAAHPEPVAAATAVNLGRVADPDDGGEGARRLIADLLDVAIARPYPCTRAETVPRDCTDGCHERGFASHPCSLGGSGARGLGGSAGRRIGVWAGGVAGFGRVASSSHPQPGRARCCPQVLVGVRLAAAGVVQAADVRSPLPLPEPFSNEPLVYADARANGISRARLRGESLRSPFTGVRVAATVAGDLVARCRVLQLVLPPGAIFCHVTALRLLGIDLPIGITADDRFHIQIPDSCSWVGRPGIATHSRSSSDVPVRRVAGLPVMTPELVWVQLATALEPRELVVLGDALIRRKEPHARMSTLGRTVAELPKGTRGSPGSAARSSRCAPARTLHGESGPMAARRRRAAVPCGERCRARLPGTLPDAARPFLPRPEDRDRV